MNLITSFFLVMVALCFLTCYAQEDSAFRRADVISYQISNAIINANTGGLSSKKCLKGDKGMKGDKGERANTGLSDNSEVDQLREEVSYLRRQLVNLTGEFRAGFKRLDDGWIGLFNGYQYKLLITTQTYTLSKDICRILGADLAVYGVQDMGNRRIIDRALDLRSRGRVGVWIGMDDLEREGLWRWLNQDKVSSDAAALWSRGEPNNVDNEDCAAMETSLTCNDVPCEDPKYALCEKQWL